MVYTREEITKIILDSGLSTEEFLAEIPKGGKYQISTLREDFNNGYGSIRIKDIIFQQDLTQIKTMDDFIEVLDKIDKFRETMGDAPLTRVTHSQK